MQHEIETVNQMKEIVARFLHEHFHLDDGTFSARRENYALGNRRYGFSHYLVGNVEIAMLTGVNERYSRESSLVNDNNDGNNNACYMELYTHQFMISTVVVLTSTYLQTEHPSIATRVRQTTDLHEFKFHGAARSARAYFTFAKLSK